MRFKFTCIASLLILFVVSAAGQTMQQTVKGNSAFACELFQQLFNKNKNVFFSPYSISSALAMTYAGARGKTAEQMSEVLHYDLYQPHTHQGFFEIDSSLAKYKSDSLIKLSVANALWKRNGLRCKPDYLEITKRYYGAALYPLTTAKPINDWADTNTYGKIKHIVTDGELADARLVLTNAIYFKADWLKGFDKKNTKKRVFNTPTGDTVMANMMSQSSKVMYYEDEQNQVIELPYKGESLSMMIILPRENSSIKTLAKNLDYDMISKYNTDLNKRKVQIYLPKFSFTEQYHLEKELPQMGMPLAFTSAADFSGISNEDLFIDKVIHRAFIKVDEKGSEAAAATAVIMGQALAPKGPTFNANRPFVFLIRDNKTGSILFMGSIVNPNAKGEN